MTLDAVAPPRNALDPLAVVMTTAGEAPTFRLVNPDGLRVIVAGALSAADLLVSELRVAAVTAPLTRLPAEVRGMPNLRLLCLGPTLAPEFMSSLRDGDIPSSVQSLGVLSGGKTVRWPETVRLPNVIDLRSDGALSFSRASFPNLGALVVKPDRGAKNLLEIARYEALHELQLLHLPDATVFSNLSHLPLRRVGLLGGRVTTLDGIGAWGQVEWLRLHTLRALESLSALKALKRLRVLELRFCRRIADIETLLELPSLERLDVLACGPIGINRIAQALRLEALDISAST